MSTNPVLNDDPSIFLGSHQVGVPKGAHPSLAHRQGMAPIVAQPVAVHQSDKHYWRWLIVAIALACLAVGVAAYCLAQVVKSTENFEKVKISDALTLGGGTSAHYLAYGTTVIRSGASGSLPTSTQVTIPPSPYPPHILLSIEQTAATTHSTATVSVSDVSTTGFTILADAVSTGTMTVPAGTTALDVTGGTAGATVDLSGFSAPVVLDVPSTLASVHVSWVAIA